MSRSKLCNLGMGPATYDPAGAATQGLLFSTFDAGHRQDPIDIGSNLGGYGNLGHPIQITRSNTKVVQPRGQFKPSLEEWDALLRWIMNCNPDGSDPWIYEFGMAATYRVLAFHDTATYHKLLGVAVNKATIRAQAGREVTLDMEMMGTDWTNSGSFPSLSPPLGTRFLFGDLGLNITGISGDIPCRSFSLEIDHQLAPDRYFYGFTQALPLNLDRMVKLTLEVPYAMAPSIWSHMQVDGGRYVSLTLTGVAGATPVTSTLEFILPSVRAPHAPPPAQVPNELFCTINAVCYADPESSNQEMFATLTPTV
jgi:hypothetical protein